MCIYNPVVCSIFVWGRIGSRENCPLEVYTPLEAFHQLSINCHERDEDSGIRFD